jgi:exopolyphosphatase/guanosine-5'-triphosphate,3'-diphosphate pyrophosphatase
MLAAIDAGSNTLRLLVGESVSGKVVPELYLRRICRLAGDFSKEEGLSPDAMERALAALEEFAEICRQFEVQQVRAVGTAAFRQAVNGEDFARQIKNLTGIPLEIISGEVEAEQMVLGVLSALDPLPEQVMIIDIGGGSTEFVLCLQQKVVWSRSLSLGVVRLVEEYPSQQDRHKAIEGILAELIAELTNVCKSNKVDLTSLTLVGTAGTVTTLAALDMQMTEYDWRRVNNYLLSLSRLQQWQSILSPLSPVEREALPGMEDGRGDLIMPGLEILLYLLQQMHVDSLTVSDFGILEGLLLSLVGEKPMSNTDKD